MVNAPPRRPRVAVVGAGLSGLVAAGALRRVGAEVVVLEARERLGGRIWTDRSWGFPVDLGATWLHGGWHSPMGRWARALGLPMYHARFGSTRFYWRGTPFTPPGLLWRTRRGAARALRSTLRARLRGGTLADALRDLVAHEGLPELDRCALAWLISFVEGVYGGPADELALGDWLAEEFVGGNLLPLEGMDRFVAAAAEGTRVRLAAPVERIRWGSEGVELEGPWGRERFGAAIVAVPLGVLQRDGLRFEPELPAWKQAAIAAIGYGGRGVLDKVALRYAEPFWPETIENLSLLPAEPRPPRGGFNVWISLLPSLGQPVLTGFAAGPPAAAHDRTDAEAWLRAAADALAEGLGRRPPQPIDHRIASWLSDPYALGAYSYNRRETSRRDRQRFARPLGPSLYFAGEAASSRHYASLQGALHAGLAAARALARDHRLPHPRPPWRW